MVVQNTAAGSIIRFTPVEPKMQLVYVQREILGTKKILFQFKEVIL